MNSFYYFPFQISSNYLCIFFLFLLFLLLMLRKFTIGPFVDVIIIIFILEIDIDSKFKRCFGCNFKDVWTPLKILIYVFLSFESISKQQNLMLQLTEYFMINIYEWLVCLNVNT